jgi:hypothetical protein
MQPRPRRIREELLEHGWWLVPLVLLFWLRQLQLPTPAPGPAQAESWHAVKGWELLTIVRLGVDSISSGGRLAWFLDSPELAQLFWWKFLGCEIVLKLALCALCAAGVLRTQGTLARLCFALALLCVPASLDALALLALLALFQRTLAAGEGRARGELGGLCLAALLAQIDFGCFSVWAAGIALVSAALWKDVSLRRAAVFLLRGLSSFLFLWILFGQSPAELPAWLKTSWWIASAADGAPSPQLPLSLAMLAALLLVLALGRGRGVLRALVLALALLAWRRDVTLFLSIAPAAAWFAPPPRGVAAGVLRAGLLVAGALALPAPDLRGAAAALRDLARPAALRERLGARGAEIGEQWALRRVQARAGVETLDVLQDAQGLAFLNGLDYHPRPVFQSRSARTPELLELNRAYFEGERAPLFALCRIDAQDGRFFAPAQDAKALDELLLRYTPCLEERGWLLLARESQPPRAHSSTPLWTREVALGEWIELADLPGAALELRLDARPSARGRLRALLLAGAQLECEFERADGSRARAQLAPGCARAGFLVRPFLGTQAELADAFLGRPVAGLRRLRLCAAAGEEALWEPSAAATLVRREGLLPPPRPDAELAFEYPDFEPPPTEVAGLVPARLAEQGGRSVHVFSAPAALRWELQPGRYRLSGTYGMLDAAWQEEPPSDGALVMVVLQQGREQRQIFRRLLEPASAREDRGFQPLELEFEVQAPADLYLRLRTGWHDNAVRDWVFWDSVKIQTR